MRTSTILAFTVLMISMSLHAQTVFPAERGNCPSGSRYSGSGYCNSTDGSNFVSAQNGNCPSGSNFAGSGYCRSPANLQFVPAHSGNCPNGTRFAGNGYCAVKR
jgi:hypothetical protein